MLVGMNPTPFSVTGVGRPSFRGDRSGFVVGDLPRDGRKSLLHYPTHTGGGRTPSFSLVLPASFSCPGRMDRDSVPQGPSSFRSGFFVGVLCTSFSTQSNSPNLPLLFSSSLCFQRSRLLRDPTRGRSARVDPLNSGPRDRYTCRSGPQGKSTCYTLRVPPKRKPSLCPGIRP